MTDTAGPRFTLFSEESDNPLGNASPHHLPLPAVDAPLDLVARLGGARAECIQSRGDEEVVGEPVEEDANHAVLALQQRQRTAVRQSLCRGVCWPGLVVCGA